MNTKKRVFFTLFIIFIFTPVSLLCETGKPVLFPNLYESKPGVPSPYTLGTSGDNVYSEYITIRMPTDNKYAVIDVTQENGEIYSCMYFLHGKGKQMFVGDRDFRSLGINGLHSEEELDGKKYITGRNIDLINYLAKPGRFSYTGFLGKDEDIISVLKSDNKIVTMLGLKHRDLAKPLFHVWNAILGKYFGPRSVKNGLVFYNGHEIYINAESGKGHQESIFHDEVEGMWNIKIHRDLNSEEIDLLKRNFPAFSNEKMKRLIEKLSSIRISEMNPFYIMRYGFYEGNTSYRADPVAVSLIFGLRSLEEIIGIFNTNLFKVMGISET